MFSESARYFNTGYLTFFHNQKNRFRRCELYEDAAEKSYRQHKHFSPIRIKLTVEWESSEGFKSVFWENGEAVKRIFCRLDIRSSKRTSNVHRLPIHSALDWKRRANLELLTVWIFTFPDHGGILSITCDASQRSTSKLLWWPGKLFRMAWAK
jgi:hypothetical protein